MAGFSNFNNPPLLPEPVARDHGHSAPFGTGSLYSRCVFCHLCRIKLIVFSPPPKSRDRTTPIVDNDAPPTESLLDGSSFNFAQHQHAHHQPLRSVAIGSSNQTQGTTSLPTHNGTVSVIVSGFYPDRAHSVVSQFTAIGDCSAPEMSAEGGNWFTITYVQPWDAARALKRDGDVINGDMMIAVRLLVCSHSMVMYDY